MEVSGGKYAVLPSQLNARALEIQVCYAQDFDTGSVQKGFQ
jgi:hypothetical protein